MRPPIQEKYFVVTQKFFNYDPVTYPKTGYHPGVDYGTQGAKDVPLYFCSSGEVIDRGFDNILGNYFYFYIPEINKTFAYCHLRDESPQLGVYASGMRCGVVGKTGMAQGIHLHLEGHHGSFKRNDRVFNNKLDILRLCFDADRFIRYLL